MQPVWRDNSLPFPDPRWQTLSPNKDAEPMRFTGSDSAQLVSPDSEELVRIQQLWDREYSISVRTRS